MGEVAPFFGGRRDRRPQEVGSAAGGARALHRCPRADSLPAMSTASQRFRISTALFFRVRGNLVENENGGANNETSRLDSQLPRPRLL